MLVTLDSSLRKPLYVQMLVAISFARAHPDRRAETGRPAGTQPRIGPKPGSASDHRGKRLRRP